MYIAYVFTNLIHSVPLLVYCGDVGVYGNGCTPLAHRPAPLTRRLVVPAAMIQYPQSRYPQSLKSNIFMSMAAGFDSYRSGSIFD